VTFVKAMIVRQDTDEAIPVFFNPTQYTLDKAALIADTPQARADTPTAQYIRGQARTLSMELFCDTYVERTDVSIFTKKIYNLVHIDGDQHAAPPVDFVWGERLIFPAYVERVSGRFTLFREDGMPLRATLNVTFKEYLGVREASRTRPMGSADHTKTRVVRRGDTLPGIAAAEYGDARAWRWIADANGIENPRRLEPARVLVIPPLPGART
jgi:nucleoid-associated protein YgaU